MQTKPAKVLGTFTLAMITMAAIVGLRNLSLSAEMGFSAVFFLVVGALAFFIPTALVIAELASAWPRPGACYVWVGEAYGKKLAFFTLWLSWMASVAWFPAVLAFMSSMLASILGPVFPNLDASISFIFISMLVVFWSVTLINFEGIKLSGLISSVGVVLGTIIPGTLIIALGAWWVFAGKPTEIPLTLPSFVPDFKLDNLVAISGVLLGFGGVELAAYHIRDAKDPQRSYPRAVLLASFLILFVYILGTLSIAMVVPQKSLCLESGLIQAFKCFFTKTGVFNAVPMLAFCLFLGALAGLNAWVIGPAKGMLVVAHDGFLPPWLDKVNSHGVPTRLLLLQAVFTSLLAFVFLYIRNSSSSIWFLTALSAQFTFLSYLIIFCAALKLRVSQPNVQRVFRVPAMWLVAGVGIISCTFCFFAVYAPHSKWVSIDVSIFCLMLIFSFIVLSLPVLYFINHRNKFQNSPSL